MVAAPMTGQGKTTVATGLMAALRDAGHVVSGHKVGPDYIDPGYHALATGRPGRNLDPHLVGEERVTPLLLHGARGAGVAVVEGVMGLHDGRIGTGGFASSAHVAALTRTPVVLVVDVSRMSRSVGALVAGMADYDPSIEVVGVILNKAGSARNVAEITRSVAPPVLGVVPRDERIASPSRHLGLVPASEREDSARVVERLGEHVANHVDLDALLEVARSAPALDARPWDPAEEVTAPGAGPRPVVAVAGGRAFTFRYTETEELLTAAGCEVVGFDPLGDAGLPAGTRGVYLGGGFPEVYAGELAANRGLLADLRDAVRDGVPTVAECAGLLYLAESLDGRSMAGAVPARARMTERLTLRYPEAVSPRDMLLTRAGERVTGHEFHRTRITPETGADGPAWEIEGAGEGFASPTLHASYLHVHWAGHPRLAARFADAVSGSGALAADRPAREGAARAPEAPSGDAHGAPGPVSGPAATDIPDTSPVDPLRHHGDAETGPGLLDLAVNVYAGPRPDWLDRALRASLDDAAAYPDPAPARAAIARRHGRDPAGVLPTAGAAEAFTLIARLRPWRRPVVVHPQFTEPHAALEQAGHTVTTVLCEEDDGFVFDPTAVPEGADLVMVGNPTNPTGVLHPAETLRALRRPGRLLVVDEAFMDAVPGEPGSLAGEGLPGVVVLRSLTKHWSIPGIRAGYLVGDPAAVRELARVQTPWSVSAPAIAATVACMSAEAVAEAERRAKELDDRRIELEAGLRGAGIGFVPSRAPFVLVKAGQGVHARLRERGIAVRRADTFPGLDAAWVRVAVRPSEITRTLLAALSAG
ncbi:cobyrinate a,c-diamide synthase [Nocardiopsis lambiniae]|uniref:Hydrogenobyrinate a,c-diamide synthase n=1 Tax=Nocardiopsis lambiniae TaxID=3075539 RepID=A0ABU2M9T3_9ACTN|nr:cobyrinate a,c-diamide synthase [Nocardiopsis sp. DSM 44743]MDT0329414.1 cobyrinate a,c-diamide synthase [Nocardiopsis sp. DSM 44743]